MRNCSLSLLNPVQKPQKCRDLCSLILHVAAQEMLHRRAVLSSTLKPIIATILSVDFTWPTDCEFRPHMRRHLSKSQ